MDGLMYHHNDYFYAFGFLRYDSVPLGLPPCSLCMISSLAQPDCLLCARRCKIKSSRNLVAVIQDVNVLVCHSAWPT